MMVFDSPEHGARGYPTESHEFEVCVVGGGMAGVCAAIAAARRGAKTALIHDRPVLGGNASSEIRMHICGAHGPNNRETGILEEILLENQYRNADGNYSVWDSVLFEKTHFCPNLTTFLNYSCCDAEVDGKRIVSVKAWGLTTQTWMVFHAKQFIDCSGDSILAPLTGAVVRWGRESSDEFGEDIAPKKADRRTMGNSLLIQMQETEAPQHFISPRWAYRFEEANDLPHRIRNSHSPGHNFWWIELGGFQDTIRDNGAIQVELMKTAYGIWDFFKNRSDFKDRLENWKLAWLGSLPGKRENRRYVGDHILTQHDVRAKGQFEDIVAYGGWSMDDHHPAGLYYPGKPTLFHAAPSPYGIPYRSLYAKSIDNLFCAGRNISTTHTAMSSTRVMATCAVMGQAVGTAAALCVANECAPRDVFPNRIAELQAQLMDDDCWLPGFARQQHRLVLQAEVSGSGQGIENLFDGHERPIGEQMHRWTGTLGQGVTLRWGRPTVVPGLRLVFDSDLNDKKRMPHRYPVNAPQNKIHGKMMKQYRIEGEVKPGEWETIYREKNNYQRLAKVELNREVHAVRFVAEETWGSSDAHLYSLDVLNEYLPMETIEIHGITWKEALSKIPAEELCAPDSGLEKDDNRPAAFGA